MPFLNMGVTVACLQSCGTMPVLKDCWNIILSGCRSSSLAICKRCALMLSGPGAQLFLRFFIFSLIFSDVKRTFSSLTFVSCSLTGMLLVSSTVKTLAKNLFM